jgi:hypothetical protein
MLALDGTVRYARLSSGQAAGSPWAGCTSETAPEKAGTVEALGRESLTARLHLRLGFGLLCSQGPTLVLLSSIMGLSMDHGKHITGPGSGIQT